MDENSANNVLIVGNPKSGKTTRAFQLASDILIANPGTYCLVLTQRAKFLRKTPNIPKKELLGERYLFKWVSTKQNLIHAACERHLYTEKPLSCILVDDLHSFITDQQFNSSTLNAVTMLWNATSVFSNCSLIVTTILKKNDPIKSFRLIMDHLEIMQDGQAEVHTFQKSLKKLNDDLLRNAI